MNIAGLLSLNNREKKFHIGALAEEKNMCVIIMKELWLKPEILDAEIEIPGSTHSERTESSTKGEGWLCIP